MIVEEVEEFEVPNEKTVEVTDVAWGLENTTSKVVDEDPEVSQVPITVSMPNQGDTFDLEGMPNLENTSSEEITGEKPSVDVPSTEGPPALPWVCFEAQIHQAEIQHWAAMFLIHAPQLGRELEKGMMPNASIDFDKPNKHH